MEISVLIQLLLPILTTGLSAAGVVPSNLLPFISSSASALANLISQLVSGKTTVGSASLAALQAVQAEVAALKAANILVTLNQANEINALSSGFADAITAYQGSLVKTDPSNLTPLPTAFPTTGAPPPPAVSGPGVGQV